MMGTTKSQLCQLAPSEIKSLQRNSSACTEHPRKLSLTKNSNSYPIGLVVVGGDQVASHELRNGILLKPRWALPGEVHQDSVDGLRPYHLFPRVDL